MQLRKLLSLLLIAMFLLSACVVVVPADTVLVTTGAVAKGGKPAVEEEKAHDGDKSRDEDKAHER